MCFGAFDIQKIRPASFGFFVYDGDMSRFDNGDSAESVSCISFARGAGGGRESTEERLHDKEKKRGKRTAQAAKSEEKQTKKEPDSRGGAQMLRRRADEA